MIILRSGIQQLLTTKEPGKDSKQQLIKFEYQKHKSSFQLLFEASSHQNIRQQKEGRLQ